MVAMDVDVAMEVDGCDDGYRVMIAAMAVYGRGYGGYMVD